MSQRSLSYASPALSIGGAPWGRRMSVICLAVATVWLAVTVAVVVLPGLLRVYRGWQMAIVAEGATFAIAYGRPISTAFLVVSVACAIGCRDAGWRSRVPACIGLALAVFYWCVAPGDGQYGRLLYGPC